MRKALMLAAGITLATALAANAQEPSATPSPSQPPASEPGAAPTMQRINVVDVSELPPSSQKQVEQVIAQGNAENVQEMRSKIDALPEAKAALEARGATSAEVVATSVADDGTLTLITKKSS